MDESCGVEFVCGDLVQDGRVVSWAAVVFGI